MNESLKNYLELTVKLNKLNKSFMDNLQRELELNNIYDVNSVQALIIKNIGNSKISINKSKKHGYYIGTNTSYNTNLLYVRGYLIKEQEENDKRNFYLSLTEEGIRVLNIVDNCLLSQYEALTKNGIKDILMENVINITDKLQKVLELNFRI